MLTAEGASSSPQGVPHGSVLLEVLDAVSSIVGARDDADLLPS